MSKKFRIHQTGYYNPPHFDLPRSKKQYFLFTDSSKHSWSGILVQYWEQTKDNGTKIKIPHPITYQRGKFQGSQKNWSTLTKEAYAIYTSFQKMVFYLKEGHVMVRSDHATLQKVLYSLMKNDKENNWSQKMHAITPHIEFEHIKGKLKFISRHPVKTETFRPTWL